MYQRPDDVVLHRIRDSDCGSAVAAVTKRLAACIERVAVGAHAMASNCSATSLRKRSCRRETRRAPATTKCILTTAQLAHVMVQT